MKVRNGFVSNSSSSSFTVVISKDRHKQILKELHPFVKTVINVLKPEDGNLFGKKVISFTRYSGNSDSFENVRFKSDQGFAKEVFKNVEDEDTDDIICDCLWEAIRMYEEEVEKAVQDHEAFICRRNF